MITMDWKVERRTEMNEELETGERRQQPSSSLETEKKSGHRFGHRSTRRSQNQQKNHVWLVSSSVVLLVLCHALTPAQCFFFPKSLFRRLSPAPSSSSSQVQHTAPSRDSRLVGSPSEQQQVQSGLRAYNNRPLGNESPSQPNPNFHVPKALCIACERFPWMPVAGSGKPQQQQPTDQYPAKSVSNANVQPSNTIVISALGQAQDGVPLPVQPANRKPFAIQFDSVQSQNNAAPQHQLSSQKQQFKEHTPTNDNANKNRDPATRPITFQIYDPPRQQPTVLRPVGNNPPPPQQPQPQQHQSGGYFNEPAPFMQPPPGYQIRPMQMFQFQPQIAYRPTVLQPVVSQSYGMVPPPPPFQQSGYNFPPRNAPQKQQQPQQQSSSSASSSNSAAPVPPITISTIVAAQHGGGGVRPQQQQQQPKQQQHAPISNFQNILPAKLVYQEHSEIHPPNIAPYKNPPQPQVQYGKPFPPSPQNIKMPIISRPPFGQFEQIKSSNNIGGYLPPPPQNRPPQGGYLPPQQSQHSGQQKPGGNQYIINLRPPVQQPAPQQQQGQRPFPSGQVFFPNQPQPQQQQQQQQAPKQQYGSPQPSGQNQQQSNQGSNDVKYGQPQSKPQTAAADSSQSHSSNIVAIPVPNQESSPPDYHQSGSTIQNQRETPSNNYVVQTAPKVPFSPPKGVVKNPHIQSIENIQPPAPPKASEGSGSNNPSTVAPSVQESGWEIIPAVQTDITHLFQNPTTPTEKTKQVTTVPVPLPVPIPISDSHAAKSPIFIVRNQGNRPLSPNDPKIHGNIVVHGITYHEEQKNKPEPIVAAAQSQQQGVSQEPPPRSPPQNVEYNTQQINNAPQQQQQQINNVPPQQQQQHQFAPQVQSQPVPNPQQQHPQIVLRPHPDSQFDPLPASISTALYHAQRTSYLTHQYWQSNANGNAGPGGRTVYVHSVPVVRPQYPQVQVSNNNLLEGGSDSSSPVASSSDLNSVEGDTTQDENIHNGISDQTTVNCQNHQQWVNSKNEPTNPPQVTQQQQQQQQQQQEQQQHVQQQPYLMYYPPPPPVQQSSIFWIQPPQQQGNQGDSGFLRLRPQMQQQQIPTGGDKSKDGPVFSKPVYEWSTPKVADQSQTQSVNKYNQVQEPIKEESRSQVQDGSGTTNGGRGQQDLKGSSEEEQYSINIPFGQKLSKRPTVTPFDIISVGGKDDSQVQSLEEENVGQPEQKQSNPNVDYQPQGPTSSSEHNSYDGSSQEVHSSDNPNGLNEFSAPPGGNENNQAPQFEDDRSSPPAHPNYIIRPVSTTIIHSPESSSYASQSFGHQTFRPQKVIVHDFTKGNSDSSSSGSDTFGESQPSSAPSEEDYGQQSQHVHSWQSFNNNVVKLKSPKLVEEYQQVDDDEEDDKQSLASVSNTKVVQYQNVATGLVTAAECAQAHSEPILLTASSETAEGKRLQDVSTKNEEKAEKVRFRQGTRFPAGRPAITSFNAWTTTTTTAIPPVDYEQGSLESGDSHNPGSASISIPVYRPPTGAHLVPSHSRFNNNKWSPPKNVILDDIYANSEVKQHSLVVETGGIGPIPTTTEDGGEHTSSSHPPTAAVTEEAPFLTTMSTEKSSSFSVSEERGGTASSSISEHISEPTGRKVPSGSDDQKVEIKFSPSVPYVERPVYIVTSAPVSTTTTTSDPTTSTSDDSTTPSLGSTSTKIVKTVRVRQRMRPGSFGVKNRFNGTTRVRVVHRPVIPDYVKHFPEFANPDSERLGKQEDEEIKNALIELKRTDRAKH